MIVYVYDAGPTRSHRARAAASWLVGAVLPELQAAALSSTTAATVAVKDDARRRDMGDPSDSGDTRLIERTLPNPPVRLAVTSRNRAEPTGVRSSYSAHVLRFEKENTVTRRGLSLLLDAAMLLIFAALMSWRLTGVPGHEWAAIGLAVLLVVHLMIHWHWVESRIARAIRGAPARTRFNVLLNAALFVAMSVAITSGFVISKIVMPNDLTPGMYLTWHGVHDSASTATLVILGLHVALNWDLIVGGVRAALRRAGPRVAPVMPAGIVSTAVRRLVWIAAAAIVVTATTRAAGAHLPPESKVMFVRADGRMEPGAPPPEITKLMPGSTRPSPSGGGGFLVRLVMLSVVAVVGRKVLRVRLV
jgi:hypothetical protein